MGSWAHSPHYLQRISSCVSTIESTKQNLAQSLPNKKPCITHSQCAILPTQVCQEHWENKNYTKHSLALMLLTFQLIGEVDLTLLEHGNSGKVYTKLDKNN